MLYYQHVHLFIDVPLLLSLWEQLGPEGTRILLAHPSLSSDLTPEMAAILKNDGAVQTLRPVFIRAMGRDKKLLADKDLIGSLRHWLVGQTKWAPPSLATVKRVLANTRVTQFSKVFPDQQQITNAVKELVEKPTMLREFIRVWAADHSYTTDESLLEVRWHT